MDKDDRNFVVFLGVERCHGDDIYNLENKSVSKHRDEHTSDRMCDKEKIDANVSLNRDATNEITADRSHANDDESSSDLNIAARLRNLVGEDLCATDSPSIADGRDERKVSSERKMALMDTWCGKKTRKQKLTCRAKDDLMAADSESNKGKGCKREKDGEQRIKVKRKTAPMNLSRKAKSFFRKKSRLAITNSDCTLILPGYRNAKAKRYVKSHGRSKVSLSLHGRNEINRMHSVLVKYNASRQDRINSRFLPNLRGAGNSFHEKPSSIPLETRELLNKSYWEYYWKLRHKIASSKSNSAAGEREECSNEDHLPESQTLRQCSVLSCMINTALRDSPIADGRSSDPKIVTSNARESVYQVSRVPSMFTKKIKRKQQALNKRLLGLRAIGRTSELGIFSIASRHQISRDRIN